MSDRSRGNPSWGYTRLRGALENLGFDLGRSTIQRILTEHGTEPAPLRGKTMPRKTFLKAHWGAIAAADFFSVEVLTRGVCWLPRPSAQEVSTTIVTPPSGSRDGARSETRSRRPIRFLWWRTALRSARADRCLDEDGTR